MPSAHEDQSPDPGAGPDGRVWLITGASSGFGRAPAEAALAAGDTVVAAARRSGAIVQLTSMGGRMSFAGVGGYSATKFALEGLTEALAGEVAPHGIRVMTVEPGAFRISFAGGAALQQSATRLDAYADTVGVFRTALPDTDGTQPGDPDRAAAAILEALDAEQTPLRLALGSDAVDAIGEYLDTARTELSRWEAVGRGADFGA
jgi:NAD(P)-dependent dehydrogenase (short-subunit alcohol dehydrogenase family)